MRTLLWSIVLLLPAITLAQPPAPFIGVNCFDLPRYADQADTIFAHLATNGVRVIRFWAFQKHCGPTGRDFTQFDKLVAAGRRHHIRLLPTLENHWKHCTYNAGQEWKPPAWYRTGWRQDRFGGAPLTFHDYLAAIAKHYRGEPQILAWQLVNEPEIYPGTATDAATMRRFAHATSRLLKRFDPTQPVSLGLLGLGQPATTGARYRRLHQLTTIDFVSSHDHGYMYEPLPGKSWPPRADSLYTGLLTAQQLGKPFLATEAGIAVEWVKGDLPKRAELFRAKLRAFFAAGGTGYVLWNYEPDPETNYGFGPADPILPMLKQTAAELGL